MISFMFNTNYFKSYVFQQKINRHVFLNLNMIFKSQFQKEILIIEPRNDKTDNVSVRPAKTHISLGIRPDWPESSLSA